MGTRRIDAKVRNAVRSDDALAPKSLLKKSREEHSLLDADGHFDGQFLEALALTLALVTSQDGWIGFTMNAKKTAMKVQVKRGSYNAQEWITNLAEAREVRLSLASDLRGLTE